MKADEKHGRDIVKTRSGGSCEANIFGICRGPGESVHHRKNRSQGGTWDPSNLLHTCGDGVRGCHGWITERPALSRANGWAVRGAMVPEQVMIRYRGRPAWLTDAGEVVFCEHVDALTLHDDRVGTYRECADCSHQFTPGGESL
jgi:hypothetical protein